MVAGANPHIQEWLRGPQGARGAESASSAVVLPGPSKALRIDLRAPEARIATGDVRELSGRGREENGPEPHVASVISGPWRHKRHQGAERIGGRCG